MDSLKLYQTLSGHTDRIWNLSWNYDGTLLASCSGDRTVRIWSFSKFTKNWTCLCVLDNRHERTIRCVSWSPCGKYLVTSGFDGKVYIEEMVSKDPLEFESKEFITDHNYEIKSVSFSPSGAYLATCSRDKTVQIFEIEDMDNPDNIEVFSHNEDVKSVIWHPLVDILVSSSYDNTIRIYKEDFDTWIEAAELVGHLSTVWKAEFNCDGNILASCSDDRTIRLWVTMNSEFTKWMCASVLDGYHEGAIFDLSWKDSSNLLATASSDNSICIFRINNNNNFIQSSNPDKEINVEYISTKRNSHDEDVNCCTWQPGFSTRSLLASGSDDNQIKLWYFVDPDMPID